MVTVITPPALGRPHPVDLLLCGHHYRVSRAELRAAGATVYDEASLLVMDSAPTIPVPAARQRQPSAGHGR